jgi:hypothetical protein
MLAGLFVALDVPLARVTLQLRVVEVDPDRPRWFGRFRTGPTDARGATPWTIRTMTHLGGTSELMTQMHNA